MESKVNLKDSMKEVKSNQIASDEATCIPTIENEVSTSTDEGTTVIRNIAEAALSAAINPENVTTKQTSDQSNIYDLDGIESVINSIPSMNFIELLKFKKDIDKELENLQGAMNLINSLEKMDGIDDLGRKVALENVLQDKEFKDDSTKFKESYPRNLQKFTLIKDAIYEELKKYDDVSKGTKFLTEQMINSINKSIGRLSSVEDSPQKNKVLHNLAVNLDAYTNRTSLGYIIEKAKKQYIVGGLRSDMFKNAAKCLAYTERIFSHIFLKGQIETFRGYLLKLFEENEKNTNLVLYHLAKLAASEKDTDCIEYIKVFAMNVNDIESGVYDLDGGKEEYDKEILALYYYYK